MKNKTASTYHSDDICIVGYGCVLPEASNPEEFWKNLIKGHCSIDPLPESRWETHRYLSKDPKEPDTTYSNYAGFVRDTQLEQIVKTRKLDSKALTRLEIMSIEASYQALSSLKAERLGQKSIFLGCMGADEELSIHKFLEEKENLLQFVQNQPEAERERLTAVLKETFETLEKNRSPKFNSVVARAAVKAIQESHGFSGRGCLIDAACASSLAAIDMGIFQLQAKTCDLAIVGGIEGQLAPENFIVFSQVGLLAKSRPHPLDRSADGMCQGEGAVVFALQRMEDAIQQQNSILGVVRGCAGSSNGQAASLFSPTVTGQHLALTKARQQSNGEPFDYYECHGTGTRVGDKTELTALSRLQPENAKTPIGSVKALIGHTKGTAGAAGLLKCLLVLKHRTIPPSPYFSAFPEAETKGLYVNTAPVPLTSKTIRLGVSAAGFGGANYHLALEEFIEGSSVVPKLQTPSESIALIGSATCQTETARAEFVNYQFKIPPKNLPQIDGVQLGALIAVAKCFEDNALPLSSFDRNRVSVFSASSTGLGGAYDFSKRIRHKEFFGRGNQADAKTLEAHKERFVKVSEDTGPGTLNNVVAGRVCNIFDFKGKNFNVDADLISLGAAMECAEMELNSKSSDLVLVLSVEENFEDRSCKFSRLSVTCLALMRETDAIAENKPIKQQVQTDYISHG